MGQTGFRNFHAGPDIAEQTLAAALRRWLAGQSWSDVRRLIEGRHVQVNGNLCTDTNRRLAATDVVKLWDHALAPPPREKDVRIRYVDQHVVVVEKPAGMTTLRHPEERHWPKRRRDLQPTLDEVLPRVVAACAPRPTRRKGPAPRLRAVHRLDRDTSGIMVFARTPQAEQHLVQQFRKHTIHRAYLAIVHGDLRGQTIETQLVKDRGDGRRGSTANPKLGRRAVTHVRPVQQLDGYTLVECRLETGRTHQIRIHLSEQGHMLCGEKVYDKPLRGERIQDDSGAPRLALHAAELGFEHPLSGETLHFRSPLPHDLAEFLQRLQHRRK
jgi:23S rRNA pseudouridine1911/1915/1917 synthase